MSLNYLSEAFDDAELVNKVLEKNDVFHIRNSKNITQETKVSQAIEGLLILGHLSQKYFASLDLDNTVASKF